MDNEMQKKKTNEKDSSLNTILFSSLVITFLLLVELFLMIVMPEMLPAIAVVGVVIVGCAYIDMSTLVKRLRKKDQEQEEQYQSILKSEKAAYLLIRKYFDEIEEQLTLMEDKFAEPFQEVIAAQKATAKVTINRSKENADALMNSNDKMLELIFSLEGKIDETTQVISASLQDESNDQSAELLQKQSEMSNQLRELELSLKNEILQAVNKLSSVSPQMMPLQQPVSMPVNEGLGSESLESLDDVGGLGDLPDFMPLDAVENMKMPEPESALDEEQEEPTLAPIEKMAEEPEAITEDLPPMPDLSDPNKVMSPDEIDSLLANMSVEASVVADEAAGTEPEPMPEVVEEPEPIPEPVKDSEVPMPDLSDPNKMMSPDDISALLASMAADTQSAASLPDVEESVEEEPEPVLEPISEPEEEKPPMPDMSDPNRQMSPDEIAALFANLG